LSAENSPPVLIADLILCMPVIEVEAKKQNKTIQNHLAHLVVHGVLHAQGFDHEDEIDALAMESLEIAILKKLKIQNPYV
jgi:probable rRNA maturation factor